MTSLRNEIETWAQALKAYDEDDYAKALDLFGRIAESGKIQTNIGIIYATIGEHDAAIDHFTKATQLDPWLGIAYFQCGVSNFLLGLYEAALKNFEEAAVTLRDNTFIDYAQLGLSYRLELAEVLFNRGLCLVYLEAGEEGIQTMQEAIKYKATTEHDVIEEAIRDGAEGYTVFSINVGILYKPPAQKVANTAPKDYLGKTIMVVGDSAQEAYTEFSRAAAERRAKGGESAPRGAKKAQRPPTNMDGAPPGLKVNGASVTATGPRQGDAPTRYNTIRVGTAESGAVLSRAGTLAPGPSRGMTISRASSSVFPPRDPAQMDTGYDDILGDYGDAEESGFPRRKPTMGGAGAGPSRGLSTKAPPRAFSPGAGGASRGVQRQRTMASSYARSVRVMSMYDEDGEMPLRLIKVKLHCKGNVRGMAMPPDVPMEEFCDLVATKFGMIVGDLNMKFADEDGTKVSLLDDSDYELALATARENAKGKLEGKLTIWIE